MTEKMQTKIWTDEVCQYWLDKAYEFVIASGMTQDEVNDYFKIHAPNEVLTYLFNKTVGGKTRVTIVDKNEG